MDDIVKLVTAEDKIKAALSMLREAVSEDARFSATSDHPSECTRICDGKIFLNRTDDPESFTIEKKGFKQKHELSPSAKNIMYEFQEGDLRVYALYTRKL